MISDIAAGRKNATCLVCHEPAKEFWKDPGDFAAYWNCERCGFVFKDRSLFLDAAAEKARYTAHQNSPDDPEYIRFLSRLAVPMMPYVLSLPGKNGLDYGCGPGPALHTLFEDAGCRMALYDPFFFPDEGVLQRTYDFCVCTEAVEHFHQPGVEFAGLASLVREGGYMGIMTRMLMPSVDFKEWWYRKDPTHVGFFRPETFCWIAERYGWQIEELTDQIMIAKILDRRIGDP